MRVHSQHPKANIKEKRIVSKGKRGALQEFGRDSGKRHGKNCQEKVILRAAQRMKRKSNPPPQNRTRSRKKSNKNKSNEPSAGGEGEKH